MWSVFLKEIIAYNFLISYQSTKKMVSRSLLQAVIYERLEDSWCRTLIAQATAVCPSFKQTLFLPKQAYHRQANPAKVIIIIIIIIYLCVFLGFSCCSWMQGCSVWCGHNSFCPLSLFVICLSRFVGLFLGRPPWLGMAQS